MDIFVLIKTMIQLFLMMILGYALFKFDIFDEHVNKKISALIVNVTSPLLVIYSVTTVETNDRILVFKLIGCGMLMYVGFIIFGKIICRFLPVDLKDRKVYELMCVFANTGFMAYPVLLSIYDYTAVFYASMIHLPFSLFVYTYGVYNLTKGSDDFNFSIKTMITPGLILTLCAVLIYALNIVLPEFLVNTINSIGGLTSPLSMMIIGSSLAVYPLKECLTDYRSYIFSIIRLFIIPLITMIICNLLKIESLIRSVAIITNAMPVASMVLMLSTQYNANKETVTKNIIVTTTLSVITIPIVVYLFV